MVTLAKMGENAQRAARTLAVLGKEKEEALYAAASALRENAKAIIAANEKDLQLAAENNMAQAMKDRLRLDEVRIEAMAKGIEDVAAEPDPVGRLLDGGTRPNGLIMQRVSVPLGVIGIIFESRPNVTSDAAALCLKAGNAVILRGGKEAYFSNRIITDIFSKAIAGKGLPALSVQLVDDLTRKSAEEMMQMTDYIDVLIPRGGGGLIQAVKNNAKVPVIETGVGNCHVYVDAFADLDMAADIISNAKTSRPSVCNAIESVLVHRDVAKKALPMIKARLDEKQVEIRGDEETLQILPGCTPAQESDWSEEFLDYILAVKVVGDIQEAVDHIARYSSKHSEAIITGNINNANFFTANVDSAAVYVNASTRYTDGAEFGLGAEIGISTQKLHARGPMGLSQLVSYKYIIHGNGQVR